MDMQGTAPCNCRDGLRRSDRRAPSQLVPPRAADATQYKRQSSLARHSLLSSLTAYLYLGQGDVSATLSLFTGAHREPRIPDRHPSKTRARYIVNVTTNTNPWIETMKLYSTKMMGFDVLGAETLAVLSVAWAPNTTTTYDTTIRM
jgi:hypothetical protein